jgi:hypothetical protein
LHLFSRPSSADGRLRFDSVVMPAKAGIHRAIGSPLSR